MSQKGDGPTTDFKKCPGLLFFYAYFFVPIFFQFFILSYTYLALKNVYFDTQIRYNKIFVFYVIIFMQKLIGYIEE